MEEKQQVNIWSHLDGDGILSMKAETEGIVLELSVDLTVQGSLGMAAAVGEKLGSLMWSVIQAMYANEDDDRRTLDGIIGRWVDARRMESEEADAMVEEFMERLGSEGIRLIIGDGEDV